MRVVWIHGTGWAQRSQRERAEKRRSREEALGSALARAGAPAVVNLTVAAWDGLGLPSPVPLPPLPGSADTGSRLLNRQLRCGCCGSAGTGRKRMLDIARGLGLDDIAGQVWRGGPDVDRYLDDGAWRERALATANAQVPHRTDVLVGHSLGSLIALELVARRPQWARPTVLVTTGSPLRHHAFRASAEHWGLSNWARAERSTPWINVYDKADTASKGTHLPEDHYGPMIQIKVNNRAYSSGHHSGSAHLSHEELGRQLGALLPGW